MPVYILSPQRLAVVGAFALTLASGHLKAQANFSSQASPVGLVARSRGITVLNVQNPGTRVDFVHAKPMPLPINPSATDSTQALIQALASASALGPSGYSPGAAGNGKMSPVFLGTPEAAENDEITPEDFGSNNHPFTTARADLYTETTNTTYPYSAAGKLFFNEPGGSFICSASLIKRGIVVTAAHCVANYGKSQFYSDWQFVPGYRNGSAPYGVWTVKQAIVLSSYYDGTDSCAVSGVVRADDVAVLILNTLQKLTTLPRDLCVASSAARYERSESAPLLHAVEGYGAVKRYTTPDGVAGSSPAEGHERSRNSNPGLNSREQGEAVLGGFLPEPTELLFLVFLFVLGGASIDVLLPVSEHPVHESG
jgi:V8-like Glu-specific endopeptidase